MLSSWTEEELVAARGVVGELVKADPLDAAAYQARYETFADDFQARVATLASQVADGSISPSQFRQRMTNLIRSSYTDAYRLGASVADDTRAFLTEADRVVLGQYLTDELQHLDSFARLLREGDLSEAWIENRASLYGDAIHGIYWEARMQHTDDDLYDAYFEAADDNNTCDACQSAAAGSPYPPSQCPRPGAETCEGFDRCRCQIRLELKPGAELGSEVNDGS